MTERSAQDIRSGLRRLAHSGQSLCETLEHGQADTPLANHFSELFQAFEHAPMNIVLIGLTQTARTQALSWLLQQDQKVLNVQDKQAAGLIELRLQSAGYSLETSSGEREEYDQLEHFLEALEQTDFIQSGDEQSWLDPVKLAIPASSNVSGLKVLMPKNLEVFEKTPALMTRVFSEANNVVIAAEAEHELSEKEAGILKQIFPNTDLVMSLVIGDKAREGWWRSPVFREARQRVNPLFTAEGKINSDVLTREDSKLRSAIFQAFHVRKFENAINAVKAFQDNEIKVMKSRKKKEDIKAKTSEKSVKSRDIQSEIDRVKAFFNDELQNLAIAMEQRDKKSLRDGGIISQETGTIIDSLLFDDLSQDVALKEIRLSMPASVINNLSARIRTSYRKILSEDLVYMRDAIDILNPKLEEMISEISDEPFTLDIKPLTEDQLWSSIDDIFSLSGNYQGKLPKRGFIQRLGEGRKSVFGVLMMITIIGMVFGGSNLRSNPLVGLLVLVLFIGSIFYTYRSWGREDVELADQELGKAKDAIKSEISRMLLEVQREKNLAVRRGFDEIKKEFSRTIDAQLKEMRKRLAEQSDSIRTKSQTNLRNIDNRLRDLQSVSQQVTRLEQQWRDVNNQARQQLQDYLRTLNKEI